MYLLQLHAGMLPTAEGGIDLGRPTQQEGWRFFARCETDQAQSCRFLFHEPKEFDQRIRKDFIRLLEFVFEAGKCGKPWAQIIQDGKVFHPVHDVTVRRAGRNGKPVDVLVKVMQFKKKGTDIRVLFVQTDMGINNVVFLHSYAKKTPKTPAAEQNRAAQAAQDFYSALDAGALTFTEQQGRGDATHLFK